VVDHVAVVVVGFHGGGVGAADDGAGAGAGGALGGAAAGGGGVCVAAAEHGGVGVVFVGGMWVCVLYGYFRGFVLVVDG